MIADAAPPGSTRIAVVGLGYVGLPLAIDLVGAGYRVHAVDASAPRVARLAAGDSYVDDVGDAQLTTALDSGRLRITTTDEPATDADVAFLCVPTPVTDAGQPDLSAILAAADYLRASLRQGDLVILQSTTYPGTTLGPLRERLEADGKRAGTDFGLAFAPERVSPGDRRPASSIPRLVGGIDPASTGRAAAILRRVSPDVMEMSSPDAAELAKLFENVFRNVNIALVNELALICERLGLDVWEVVEGASTKPFGFMPFFPGPGVGGHCIPVDPYYLAYRAREVGYHERFIATAGDLNDQMPQHVVGLVQRALNDRGRALSGAKVLVVGVAFKPNVSDARNTPAAPIIDGLRAAGADASYHDELVREFCPRGVPGCDACLTSQALEPAVAAAPDCVVIVTPHAGLDWDLLLRADLLVDTRNATRGRDLRPRQVLRLGAGWS